jgi:hypothetical protein
MFSMRRYNGDRRMSRRKNIRKNKKGLKTIEA